MEKCRWGAHHPSLGLWAYLYSDNDITNQINRKTAYRFFEAEVGADEGQWDGNAKPESKEGDQSTERHCSTAALDPQDQIQHKEHTKHDPKHTHTHTHTQIPGLRSNRLHQNPCRP